MVIIPTVIEKGATIERAYDLYSLLLKERIILCTGEIDDDLASSICGQLLYLASLSNDPIQFYINSPGGSISAGLAIIDTIDFIQAEVSTIGLGICASMAAVLLACGTSGKRAALKNCEVMIHQPHATMQGQSTDLTLAASHIAKLKERLSTILAKQTHQSIEKIRQDSERDFYMDAIEAKAYGIVDEIL